jgi:hypothetical protein
MEDNKPQKHYGLFTAICMVVGIVIGSGVFFKAQDILNYTNGNMMLGIFAWLIGGAVMILCALAFANLATKYAKVNGIVVFTAGEEREGAEQRQDRKQKSFCDFHLIFLPSCGRDLQDPSTWSF